MEVNQRAGAWRLAFGGKSLKRNGMPIRSAAHSSELTVLLTSNMEYMMNGSGDIDYFISNMWWMDGRTNEWMDFSWMDTRRAFQ